MGEPLSDLELLQRWREGDLAAGDTLFTRHFDAVHRFFRGKLADDVEDLVQRTFMALLEADTFARPIESVRAWLFGTARHLLFERWRARHDFDPSTSTLLGLEPSPSKIMAEVGEQRLLAAALRRIPLDAQILLEAHYWEAMSGREIAVAFGEPEGTIRSRLRRAKQDLREALARIAETPSLLASTVADLERWIASLRDQVPRRAPRR